MIHLSGRSRCPLKVCHARERVAHTIMHGRGCGKTEGRNKMTILAVAMACCDEARCVIEMLQEGGAGLVVWRTEACAVS